MTSSADLSCLDFQDFQRVVQEFAVRTDCDEVVFEFDDLEDASSAINIKTDPEALIRLYEAVRSGYGVTIRVRPPAE